MKGRHVFYMVIAIVLGGMLPAFSDGATVSNVAFLQGPNGTLGTKVDITYDLASPNGNCTVSARLSKDNGATFPFAITTATGDIGANMTPGTGKHIVWDVAASFPNETIAQAQVQILADDNTAPEIQMLNVPAGTFSMGRRSDGDDATYGSSSEDPQHSVALASFWIMKYHVSNGQYADALNWAKQHGYLYNSSGNPWSGSGDIYGGGPPVRILIKITDAGCNIQYVNNLFSVKTRTSAGGPLAMDLHPVVDVSWYGAVEFSNWVSEWAGLPHCYDLSNWTFRIVPPASGGYRLPTEAEWERAAAWNGTKHWIYGFTADTLTGTDRCNYGVNNPLALTSYPYTSPIGWFDGKTGTQDSRSPAGCYDMSGDACQWVHDWFANYTSGSQVNPTGPASGTNRVLRGGSWFNDARYCRTAFRFSLTPESVVNYAGFRLARSN